MCYRHAVSSVTTFEDREVLPGNVKPTHYDVTIRPDMEKFTFTGTVNIRY